MRTAVANLLVLVLAAAGPGACTAPPLDPDSGSTRPEAGTSPADAAGDGASDRGTADPGTLPLDATPVERDAAPSDLDVVDAPGHDVVVDAAQVATDGAADAGDVAWVDLDARVLERDGGAPFDAGGLQADAGGQIPDAGEHLQDAGDPLDDAAADANGAGPVLYTADRTQSPIPADLVDHLRAIAQSASRDDSVFMKVGDSISSSSQFMQCFTGNLPPNWSRPEETNIDLAERDPSGELAEAIAALRATAIGTETCLDRDSLAARAGVGASWPLLGSPTPLQAELDATNARFAVVMYGSNDIGFGGGADYPLELKLVPYFRNMLAIVDALIARGVVPVLSTMPPRTDDPGYPWIVPVFTAVTRAIAQRRRVPLVDYHREMQALGAAASFGMSGDGIHPSAQDYNTACHFDDASMARHGYNLRNLFTLEALVRARQVVVDGAAALDLESPRLQGHGTVGDPALIQDLPFADLRGTSEATSQVLADYTGCSGAPSAPGAEQVYRLVLPRATRLRAVVLDQQSVTVHLYLLDSTAEPATCLAHAPSLIAATLAAGTYHLVVDTPGTTSVEYALLVVECDPADARCD